MKKGEATLRGISGPPCMSVVGHKADMTAGAADVRLRAPQADICLLKSCSQNWTLVQLKADPNRRRRCTGQDDVCKEGTMIGSGIRLSIVLLTLFVASILTSVSASAQQSPVTAIDILLNPDQSMLQRANDANARLLKSFSEGLRFGTRRILRTSRCCNGMSRRQTSTKFMLLLAMCWLASKSPTGS